ncbi:MAG: EAL domain-containing protein, partial [Firmicutes bacterium]|nr:EAL domain-containing protein [Bacillota bacterium]
VNRQNLVSSELDQLQIALIEQEAGQRGYDLTGNAFFLGPYNRGTSAFARAAARLDQLTGLSSPRLRSFVSVAIHDGALWHARYGAPQIAERRRGIAVSRASLLRGRLAFSGFTRAITAATGLVARDTEAAVQEVARANHLLMIMTILLLPIMIGLVVIALLYQFRRFVYPLVGLERRVREYAAGRFDTPADGVATDSELYTLFHDIEAMRQALQQQFRLMRSRYRSLFQSSQIGVVSLTDGGEIAEMNKAALDLFGYEGPRAHGRDLWKSVRPEDADRARTFVERVRAGQAQQLEIDIVHRDGEARSVDVAAFPLYYSGAARPDEVFLVLSDVTERNAMLSQLEYMAFHDPLTGFLNRRGLERELARFVKAVDGGELTRFAVLYVDVDNFKLINDGFGHEQGDWLLRELAQRLRVAGAEAVIARNSGDEFVLLQPEASAQAAEQLAAALLRDIEEPFVIGDTQVVITASIGQVSYPDGARDVAELMKYADSAMYAAKELGKNRTQVFDPASDRGTYPKLQLISDFNLALERGEFRLVYQPQVQCDTGRIVGAEALLRWQHPTRGLLTPDRFVQLAEESGHIVPIGEWVVREAIAQCRRWHEEGFADMKIAVNLSPIQFLRSDLLETIMSALSDGRLAPRYLQVEITEQIMIKDDHALRVLNKLQEIGVRVSIDDFGTGFSSLGYLRRLPVSEVKIDRSFVTHLMSSPVDRSIITTIISLGRAMNLHIVAEGVETSDQLAFLREATCDTLQGYFFSAPVAAEKFRELLQGATCT